MEKLGIEDLDFFRDFFERSNTRLKCLLVDLLGRVGGPEAADFLTEVFDEEFFTVRRRLARALGELGDGKAVPFLLKVRKDDPSEEVRKDAEHALKKLSIKK